MTATGELPEAESGKRFNRGLAQLVSAEGISVAGDWILNTAASIAVFKETGSTAAVSALLALAALPTLALAPIAGAIADRRDRRRVMAAADLASAAVLALCILVATAGSEMIAAFGAVFVVAGLATFHRPASEALLPSLVLPRDLGRANSTLRLGARLAMIIGPAAAGLLMTSGGFRLVLAIDAVSFVVSAVLVAAIPAVIMPAVAQGQSAFRSAAAGLTYARRSNRVRTVILAIGVTMLVAPIINAGTLTLVADTLHLPDNRYGVLLASEGAGALALAIVFMSLGPRLKLLPFGALGLLTTGGATVALGLAPGFAAALAAMAVMGMGVVGLQVCFASYLQRETVDEFRGRVMSLVSMVASLAGLVGFALAGPFVYAFGVRQAFVGAGIVICLSALPVLQLVLSQRTAVPRVEDVRA